MEALSLGASEAAAAAGEHPRKSRVTLYRQLVGELARDEGNRHTKWGQILEPVVRQEYADRHGVAVAIPAAPLFHPQAPWRRASPDGLVLRRSGHPAVDDGPALYGLECKAPEWTTGHEWGDSGTDDMPRAYFVQCVWSIHIAMALQRILEPRWDLAALIGAHDYREYRVDRDEDLEGLLCEEVERFWVDHVQARVPPPPDGTTEYSRYLTQRWAGVREEFVQADALTEHRIGHLRELRALARNLEREIEEEEQHLRLAIGDAAGIDSEQHGRLVCRFRRGHPRPGQVLAELVETGRLTAAELAELTEKHRGDRSRPLMTPRGWSKDA